MRSFDLAPRLCIAIDKPLSASRPMGYIRIYGDGSVLQKRTERMICMI